MHTVYDLSHHMNSIGPTCDNWFNRKFSNGNYQPILRFVNGRKSSNLNNIINARMSTWCNKRFVFKFTVNGNRVQHYIIQGCR